MRSIPLPVDKVGLVGAEAPRPTCQQAVTAPCTSAAPQRDDFVIHHSDLFNHPLAISAAARGTLTVSPVACATPPAKRRTSG